MKLHIAGLTLLLAALPSRAIDPTPSGLTVHEWGTFLAIDGSDGVRAPFVLPRAWTVLDAILSHARSSGAPTLRRLLARAPLG